MKLVIVESPTKAKTITNFLGKGFVVESTYGHIRDLPKSTLGIDVEKNFEPHYVIPKKARPVLKKLKIVSKKAESVILATDEDREGEAIAWHIVKALGFDDNNLQLATSKKLEAKVERIVFHEITKDAIQEALEHPRSVDMNLVNAQQARRLLDRLVGYKLSPFLWKKVMKRLSAGRVQSVALRLIADREEEIKKFKQIEYWSIIARLASKKEGEIEATLSAVNDKPILKLGITTKDEAQRLEKALNESSFYVKEIQKRNVKKYPLPPFTTSTLQQEAAQRLGYSAKQTMYIAQTLYEGTTLNNETVGLITYMRTDSVTIAEKARGQTLDFIEKEFGKQYAEKGGRVFKTKSKIAQEAHEAIRPTDVYRTPLSLKNYLDQKQYRLYKLIWERFTATQMSAAELKGLSITVATKNGGATTYFLKATGQTIDFDGFLRVYPQKTKEVSLPELEENEPLKLLRIEPNQHFTQPPPRFSESTLVKTLEEYDIGRPSTYAPIISTILERGYVTKNEQKRFVPTEIGTIVNNILVEHFPNIVDIGFTAEMEKKLDHIAVGTTSANAMLGDFYAPFEKLLEEKYQTVEKQTLTQESDEVCEKCGKPLVVRYGRFGKFFACSGFPECKFTKSLPPVSLQIQCPQCREGEIVLRKTRKKRIFYGCSRYPQCQFALWQKPTGEFCPTCNSPLVETKTHINCSNKECKYRKIKTS